MLTNPLAQLLREARPYTRATPAAHRLLTTVRTHVRRVLSSYPDHYFELSTRDDEALMSLSDQLYTVCVQKILIRPPYRLRAPFLTFIEEDFEDPTIRSLTFYARLSLLKELIRDERDFNIRRDARLRWKDQLYRELGPMLSRVGVPVREGRGPERWTLSGLRAPCAAEELPGRLRRLLPGAEPEALVREALRLSPTPLTRSALTNLLESVLGGPPEHRREDEADPDQQPVNPNAEEDAMVRDLMRQAWATLSADDRILVAGLARGEDPAVIAASFANPVTLTRAIDRVGSHFLERIAAILDQTPTRLRPREQLEPFLDLLLPLLPELEHTP